MIRVIDEINLGSAWAGSTVNCVPFRCEAVLSESDRRLVSFYDGNGEPTVAEISYRTTGAPGLTQYKLPNAGLPHDAHKCISMELGADLRLYVAFGAHASRLSIYRSRSADLQHGFEEIGLQPKDQHRGVTYPMFIGRSAQGTPCLLYRAGTAFGGAAYAADWSDMRKRYISRDKPLIEGRRDEYLPRSGPYLNLPALAPDGRIAFFIAWRRAANRDKTHWYNAGLDFAWATNDLSSLQNCNAKTIELPVMPTNSLAAVVVGNERCLINQATTAVRYDGAPMAMTYWADDEGRPQYRLIWRDGASWRSTVASQFNTAFTLSGKGTLPLPHSRPYLLVDKRGRAHAIFRSNEFGNRLMLSWADPPNYTFSVDQAAILWDDDLGFYEPVFDRAAWAVSGELVGYVQSCNQSMGDDESPVVSSPGRTVRWSTAPNRIP